MGFVSEDAGLGRQAPPQRKENIAVVYGKQAYMWQVVTRARPSPILRTAALFLTFIHWQNVLVTSDLYKVQKYFLETDLMLWHKDWY